MSEIEHDPESGCAECPFASDEMGPTCQATGRNLGEGYEWATVTPECALVLTPAPSWCPLRSGPVTVRRPSVTSA